MRIRKFLSAIREMLQVFRAGPRRAPAPMPDIHPAGVCPKPLPTQLIAETGDRDILLISRALHAIQNPEASPDPRVSAAGFPLHIYKEVFQSGPARHATWAHVCTTTGKTPLLIYSKPRR